MASRRITLELPPEVLARAGEIAGRTHRVLEDVLADWLTHYADDLPVESLSDEQVLDLCRFQINIVQQQELSNLLHHHRERQLTASETARLDELVQVHRRGLVRQARAIQVATARGLKLPRY
jgi:hypothetical protein